MEDSVSAKSPRMLYMEAEGVDYELAEEKEELEDDPMNRKETIELVRDYYLIPDQEVADNIRKLVSSLAHRTNTRRYED
jgi:H2-forming N5,N10-methylenetetrahydromethanopterin dehydrogenase-like enzyme